VLAVGLLALGLGADTAPGSASQPPSPEEVDRRYREFNARPRFVGELNGFTFYEREPDAAARGIPVCAGPVERYATAAELEASPLNFSVGYLPAGFRPLEATATACGDQVVTVTRTFGGSRSGFVWIVRVAGRPFVQAIAPRDYLQAGVVGGRPAVTRLPIVPGHWTTVWVRDRISVWAVSCMGISPQECGKVAAAVR